MQNFFLNNYSGRSDETIVRPFSCRIVPQITFSMKNIECMLICGNYFKKRYIIHIPNGCITDEVFMTEQYCYSQWLLQTTEIFLSFVAEKKQKSRQKEPQPSEEDADNEIMDLSDPERITKERGGWWHHKGPRYITLAQECDDSGPSLPCQGSVPCS